MRKSTNKKPRLSQKEKVAALKDGTIAAIRLLRARSTVSLRDAVEIVRSFLAKPPPAWTKNVNPKAFASCDANGGQETMIHVYWSALGDVRDTREGGHGHRMQRDRVSASLGLDRAPVPGFTPDEMQTITHAAKMAALKCLSERSRRGR
jgi:hypothetical protein